ncbi:MAG: protein phosphatase 2C domain-containing protein [Myxococcales bacterium]|nr:protein phosphatase 2C domain-containing protein [Myxococcales bacterium]
MRTREREVTVQIGERNDHGGSPELNRDALGHASLLAGHLLVLASGTGGTGGGRVEGNLAVSAVLTHFRTSSDAPIGDRLIDSLRRADELLAARSAQDPSLKGSGASCAAVLVQEGYCHAARAGEVRAFVIRGGQAHELAGESPETAQRSEMDMRSPAARIGALGAGQQTCIHVIREPLKLAKGDRIVLASPGLLSQLDQAEFARVSGTLVPQVAAGRLVDTARKSGASGGISVQIVQYGDTHIQEKQSQPTVSKTPAVVMATAASRGATAHRSATTVLRNTPGPTLPAPAVASEVPQLAPTNEPHRVEEPANRKAKIPAAAHQGHQIETSSEFNDYKYDFSEYAPDPEVRPRSTATTPPSRPGIPFGKFSHISSSWVAPLALAALGIAALTWWSPWSSDESAYESSLDGSSVAPGNVPADDNSARAMQPGAPTSVGDPPNRHDETEIVDPSPSEFEAPPVIPRPTNTNSANIGFWQQAGDTLQSGNTITATTARGWLEKDGATGDAEVAAAAKARLVELRRLEAALVHSTAAADVLTGDLTTELDSIFTAPIPTAVVRLKKTIEAGFQTHNDKIFEAVSAYVAARRDPQVVAILLAFSESRVGPKTKSWLTAELHRMLVGLPMETNVLRLEPVE